MNFDRTFEIYDVSMGNNVTEKVHSKIIIEIIGFHTIDKNGHTSHKIVFLMFLWDTM